MELNNNNKKSFIKRIFSSKWRWIIITIVIIAIGGVVIAARPKNDNNYLTDTVKRQNLQQLVEAAGTVESTKGLDLSFTISGPISFLNANVGQKVKAGDLLVSLAAQKQEAQVAVAQAAVKAAAADLLRVTSGASAEDLAVAEQKVVQANSRLQAAQSSLTSLQQQQSADMSNWRSALYQSLITNLFVATRANNEAYTVLSNNDATSYFRLLANTDYTNALVKQNNLSGNLQLFNDHLNQIDTNDYTILIKSADEIISGLLDVQLLLDNTLSLLQRLYAAPPEFTQTELDTLKTTVATQQSYVSASLTAVQTAKATLVNGQASYVTKIDQAESSVVDAQTALALAQAQQQQTAAPARQFEVEQAQAKLSQAQADLQRNQATLEDYRLRAPIDGVITRVDIRVGEQATAGKAIISLLGDIPLQIKVKVPEADVPKVATGQSVTITLDAFGDNHPFAGQVAAVDLSPTLIEGVVYYYVTVMFTGNVEGVKLGMSADVDILTAQRDNVLVIPFRAVKSKNGSLYVQVIKTDKSLEDRQVQIGLRGEDGLTELISGLNEGEQIVTLNRSAK